ncbi:RNA ligase/cyclic nucleotide phosphodiesterase [Durotheca rogersii]|uniref:RNA ligase/cyclic nucleotide phosphodiesterase n=1 Tax=Durotheca rogersii TaxID=419775 RepID=UPI0022211BE6|nr:RNA ligase/cyclic nucleotide phosphodiesterase [Durotheca rogersii]KAI5861202.1 RNA ligase/cyclic nucleotide phosphodiesterase [Durotheca rogersii]
MGSALESTDVRNKLEDLSGVVPKPGENPYDALIEACDDDPAKIQELYAAHRARRNAQQRARFLSPDFTELIIDPYLLRLENPAIEPGFVRPTPFPRTRVPPSRTRSRGATHPRYPAARGPQPANARQEDRRHCMTVWARPPNHVLELAEEVQRRLRAAAPHVWLMPAYRMHMTTLELAFSRTAAEISALLAALGRDAVRALADYTATPARRRAPARLVRPFVSYDLSAFALSFVPASGHEPRASPPPAQPGPLDDEHDDHHEGEPIQEPGQPPRPDRYTYHHLRRDLWARARAAGVAVDSRYVVPSAHVTLGRYLGDADHATAAQRRRWVDAIDEVNRWLEGEVWAVAAAPPGGASPAAPRRRFVGEWIVGQEKGFDVRVGTLWYGGGRTVLLGEGF